MAYFYSVILYCYTTVLGKRGGGVCVYCICISSKSDIIATILHIIKTHSNKIQSKLKINFQYNIYTMGFMHISLANSTTCPNLVFLKFRENINHLLRKRRDK